VGHIQSGFPDAPRVPMAVASFTAKAPFNKDLEGVSSIRTVIFVSLSSLVRREFTARKGGCVALHYAGKWIHW